MKRTTHTPKQIIRLLKTAELLLGQGNRVVKVCCIIEVTHAATHP